MELKQEVTQGLEPRIKNLSWGMLICIALIFFRLYYLQGIRGAFYLLFSEENSVREIPRPSARGVLWDRNGKILADNRPAFDLVLIPQYVLDPPKVLATLNQNLHLGEDWLQAVWEKRKSLPPFQAISILEDVSPDVVSWVRAHKNPWGKLGREIDLRGVDIRLRYVRDYPQGEIAPHVLGYVREIDAKRLKEYQEKWPGRYRLGDSVGVRGLEEVWDTEIRGEDGFVQKVVNAVGREIILPELEGELVQKEAMHGHSLRLTLSARLQQVAHDYFLEKGKGGAAVALDPNDGSVLLLYSAPAFDLNRLGGRLDQSYWKEIITSPKKYLLNRAIQGAYPPGSVYKIVTGMGALSEEVVGPANTFYCGGTMRFGNRTWHCWKDHGHGVVSFFRGLVASCDVYFYNLGLKLGVDRLAKYAFALGLGSPTGVGLPNERSGLIPTSEWKKKFKGEEWQEGETLSVAIGQGADLVTPIQAAQMIAMIGNGGKKIQPHLVTSTVNPLTGEEKRVKKEARPENKNSATLSPEILKLVKEALVGVVGNPEGTAHRLSLLGIPMGGKTGTSQVVSLGKDCRGDRCEDHAWFVAFAPAEDPKIAVAVVVEHGGHGSSGAAPLAGEIIKEYLKE